MTATVNIARFLPEAARKHPFKKAVICLDRMVGERFSYVHQTFSEVDDLSNRYAHGLKALGFSQGMKVLLAVRPGMDFVPLTFALFKIGAVPVLIDPGMGKENLLQCIELVAPEALIGVAQAHIAKLFKPGAFKSVKHSIVVGRKFLLPGLALSDVLSKNREEFEIAKTKAHDMAAIVYTTGSTGIPKGVVYFHEQMEGQVRLIRDRFQIPDHAVDLPIFPLFALFAVAWGITAVIPHMDPTKPALANEEILIRQILDQGVSFSIGSPALWDRLGAYCESKKITLPCLKQILMVGAPVRPYILKRFQNVLPDGETYTPYGATEALPVAVISGTEILSSTARLSEQGKGTCIGKAFPDITIRVIHISQEAIPKWDESLLCAANEVGEIVVKGPIVTQEYFLLPEATALAKIRDEDSVWHRMGDLGYLDEMGRLWFCGRKAHRVETETRRFLSVCCEAIFNQHVKVHRTALVGITKHGGQKIPVIVVEPKANQMPQSPEEKQKFVNELLELGKQHEHTIDIKDFLFHPSFPVDIRHNAKIFREKLGVWAQNQIGDCSSCGH